MDDIAVNIRCDASELTSGMTASRDQVEQTTVAIQRQESSWGSLATATLSAIGGITSLLSKSVQAQRAMTTATVASAAASAAATPPTLTFGAAVNFALSPVVLIAGALTLAAGAVYYFSSAEEEAAAATTSASQAADGASTSFGTLGRVTEAIEASQFGQDLSANMTAIQDGASELYAAFSDLGSAIEEPFIAAGFQAGGLLEAITGINSKLAAFATGLRAAKDVIDTVTESTRAGIRQLAILIEMGSSWSGPEAAAAAVDQRAAEQAADLEKLRAAKARAEAEELLKKLTEDATRAVREQGEVAAIASITTVAGIDAAREAMTAKLAEMARAGTLDAEAVQHAKALTDALEKQKAAIESGAAAEQERRDKERAEQQALEQARREAERAMQQAAEASWQAMVRAEDQITALQDQYDVLAGTASEADIAMRNALRGGATEEQAQRIKELAEANAKLREKEEEAAEASKNAGTAKSKSAFGGNQGAAAAAVRGSREAYSAIISNANNPQLRLTKKQIEEAQETNRLLKEANKKHGFQPVRIT